VLVDAGEMLLECPQEPDKVWQSDVEEEAKKMLH